MHIYWQSPFQTSLYLFLIFICSCYAAASTVLWHGYDIEASPHVLMSCTFLTIICTCSRIPIRSHTAWFELILIQNYTKAIKIYNVMGLFKIFLDIDVVEKNHFARHVCSCTGVYRLICHLFYILRCIFCFFLVIDVPSMLQTCCNYLVFSYHHAYLWWFLSFFQYSYS
jgi:hypothetical protein